MVNKMKLKIGIMGAASGPVSVDKRYLRKAFLVGKSVAEHDCILVNGACPGLPDAAAHGAKCCKGICIGISPAFSEEEHVKIYKSPIHYHDILLYTGFGLMERDILNIRSSDAVIILGGGIGTLNEFTVAYDEGVPLGILTDCGGISNHIPEILKMCKRKVTRNMIFESDPQRLVKRLITLIKKRPRPLLEDNSFKMGKYLKKNKSMRPHR